MTEILLRLRSPLIVTFLVATAFLLPFVLTGTQESMLTRALIFGLMAAGLDLAYGHAGLYSIGHAALAGVGGYTVGLLMVKYGIDSFWLLLPAALAAAALASAVFGILALRTRGLYFILVTLALGQMLSNLALQWDYLKTSQAEAVTGIVMPTLGVATEWTSGTIYQFILVVVVLAMFVIQRMIGSPFGLALRGGRENRVRMGAMGYSVWHYQLAALVVSGMFCGVAGALFAFHNGLISPNNIGIATSGLLVLMVIIGGTGTRFGAFIGGVVVILLESYATQWSMERSQLIIGALFIVTALLIRFRPKLIAAARSVREEGARHVVAGSR